MTDPTEGDEPTLTDAERRRLGGWLRHRGVYSFGLLADIAGCVDRILADRARSAPAATPTGTAVPSGDECGSCGVPGADEDDCAESRRPCGHHSGHSWCDWCGQRVDSGAGQRTVTVEDEIVSERARQVSKGYTDDHDDRHSIGELVDYSLGRIDRYGDPEDIPRAALIEAATVLIAAVKSVDRRAALRGDDR